jgi:hypothetical protein
MLILQPLWLMLESMGLKVRWYTKFWLLTLVSIMITVMACSLDNRYKSFGAACCLHLQGRRVTEATGSSETKICTSEATQCYEQEEIWLRSGTSDSNHGYISNHVTATHSTKSTSRCSLNCVLLVGLRSSVIQLLNLSKSSHDFDLLALWMKTNRAYNDALNWQWYDPRWSTVTHRGILHLWCNLKVHYHAHKIPPRIQATHSYPVLRSILILSYCLCHAFQMVSDFQFCHKYFSLLPSLISRC